MAACRRPARARRAVCARARRRAGLSQRELAFPGCTAVYVCRIEKGDRVPSLQVLRELARRLDVSEEWLARGAEGGAPDLLVEADVALRLDQLELAEHLYTQALEAATAPQQRGRALAGLGRIDLRAGRLDDAVRRLEDAYALLGDAVADEWEIPNSLARAYHARGESEMAIGVLRHAVELARARGDDLYRSRFTVLLANALIDSGNLAAARELLGGVVAEELSAGDPVVQARLYWSQSRLHSAERNYDAASRYARMALATLEVTDHAAHVAMAHHLLAYVELERGNAEEALELLERGYPLAARAGGADARARFRLERARALAALGRSEEAAALALEVAGELAAAGRPEAGRAYALAADIHAGLGERARALELYELAAELLQEAPTYRVEVWSKLAELLEAEGRKDEALELLKRAVGARAAAERTREG